MLTIDRWNRDYVVVTFPYDDVLREFIREVPGRMWVQNMKHWRIPIGSVNELLQGLVAREVPTEITPMANLMVRAYGSTTKQLVDIKAREGDKEIQIAGMPYTLRPYQAKGVDFITTANRCLVADEMGLGKTVQAIGAILLWQPRTTLVVVMNSLKHNWLKEFRKHAPELNPIVVEGNKIKRQQIWNSSYYPIKICNYELLYHDADVMPMNWDCIIADEASKIKSHASQAAKKIKNLSSHYAVAMTGTPLENSPMETHSIFEFVREGLLPNRWDFRNNHIMTGFNGTVAGYRNIPDFHRRIVPFMLRRKKADVLKDLPPKIYDPRYIELSEEERRFYLKWRRLVVQEVDVMGRITNLWTQNVLTRMLRLKQIVDHPLLLEDKFDKIPSKMSALIDIVDETDEKIVVFTQFKQMAHILKRHFETEEISGDVGAEERLNIIERFDNNDKQVLISTDAGAYGLNIVSASIVVHYDLTWNPAKQAQREDRLHRIGQLNPVTVIELIAEDTIDQYIKEVLYRKMEAFKVFIDQADEAMLGKITHQDIEAMLAIG